MAVGCGKKASFVMAQPRLYRLQFAALALAQHSYYSVLVPYVCTLYTKSV